MLIKKQLQDSEGILTEASTDAILGPKERQEKT
jgi:hypothetical protein